MPRDDDPQHCRRRHTVARLRAQGDWRWRTVATQDLGEMAEDEAGLDVLTKAIAAMLRKDREGR